MSANSASKIASEISSLLVHPARGLALTRMLAGDKVRSMLERPHLYAYTRPHHPTEEMLATVMHWLKGAHMRDGGIAAYYSLFSGFSASYPETTGYIIPTLYDYAQLSGDRSYARMAEDATTWLLHLQAPDGSFPGGLAGDDGGPSVFNTGQILQGLVRAAVETRDEKIQHSAFRAGCWLADEQKSDGRWEGATYQGRAHSYYTMVALSLANLSKALGDPRFQDAANRNLQFTMSFQRSDGWYDQINLEGHPPYLHFVAYVIQGIVETALLAQNESAFESGRTAAWKLLRMFELKKSLPGEFADHWKTKSRFVCLTGMAQISIVWLRIFEHTGDLRYLNAALKINEFLKSHIRKTGGRNVRGGVAGSFPIHGRYQPFRLISWGNKFTADALMGEIKALQEIERR